MTYRWLDDLDAALDAHGVPYTPVDAHGADYTESDSWRTRGRPASTGDFDPVGVLCHHTASPAGTTDEADINCLMWGNSQAPGPVSQLYIGRSGVVYVLAAGRANHGGQGRRPGVDYSCADMNAALVGIEAGNDGIGEPWSDAQTDIYAETVAALCLWYRWPRESIYLHATTGPPSGGCNSKIDPAGPWQRQPQLTGQTWDLETWRAFCVEHAHQYPLPPDPEGESMPAYINNGGPATFAMTGGMCHWISDPGDADRLGVPPANDLGQRGAAVTPSLFKGLILVGPMPPDYNAGWFAAWWPAGRPE